MTFDLHRITDTELDSSDVADPHELSRRVSLSIPLEYRDEALLVALAAYTEARIHERQHDGMPTPTAPNAASLRTRKVDHS